HLAKRYEHRQIVENEVCHVVVFHDPPRERSRLTVQIEADNGIIIAKVFVRVGPDRIVKRPMKAERLGLRQEEARLRPFSVVAPSLRARIVAVMVVAVARRPMVVGLCLQRTVKSLGQRRAPSPIPGLFHLPLATAWNPPRTPRSETGGVYTGSVAA